MKKLILLSTLFFLGSAVPVWAQASLILTNARVITLNDQQPVAGAVAITGNRILAVGTTREMMKYKNAKTTVIDVQGKTLIPGLYDSHLHVIRGGRFFNSELRWDGVKSLKRALEMLREQAERTPEGQWVRVVGGWSQYQFMEKRLPTLEEINQATGKTPAFILHLYGQAFLNKAGLQKLGINENTPNPAGGLIHKDEYGQPTGLLVAEPSAFILYSTLARLPELDAQEKINSTKRFITELNSLGVTSVMDAGGGFQNFPDDYAITDTLNARGELNIRLPYYLFAQKAGTELQDYRKWMAMVDFIDHGPGHKDQDNLSAYFASGAGENLVASASDFENFTKPRPELSPVMDSQLKAVISELVKNCWPFRLHATYNESITRFLDVIEAVNKEAPLKGLNWFFDHAETVSDENLNRIKALNGGISIQDRMAFQAESFIARYGKAAALHTPPLSKIIEKGIRLGAGTDGTRVSSYNPWIGLYWLISGKSVGGLSFMARENQLDRITALKLYTSGSASLMHQDDTRGMVKPGYLADIVLLSQDILDVEIESIPDIRSLLTILNGKVVYGAGNFARYAPKIPGAIPHWSPVNFYSDHEHP